MTTSLRRGRQLLALALASTTVVVAAGASAAAAAPAGTTTSSLYSGSADSSAVQLVLTLPSALSAVTGAAGPLLPNPIDLSLIRSTGMVTHDGKNADVSTSASDLAQGSLVSNSALTPALTPLLSHTVTSSLTTPNPAPFALASLPPNPLGLNLNLTPLTAITNPGTKSTSADGGVANGALASLSTLAPQVTVPLQSALTTVNTQLGSALTQLTAALGTAAAPVSSVTVPLAGALTGIPTVTVPATPLTPATTVSVGTLLGGSLTDPVGQLTTTLNNLPALIAKVEDELLNGAALSLDGVSSTENVAPLGAGTESTGAANVATINLFGGLVQVQATRASADAVAPGTAGKATSTSSATLLKVVVGQDIGNLLTLIADDNGLTAGLLTGSSPVIGTALQPVLTTVNGALAGVLSALTGLLQGLNSDAKILQQGTATHSVSADGTHAEAHATPAEVSIGLPGAANLIALSLGKVDVVANQQNISTTTTATPVTTTVKPPTVTTVPRRPAKPVAPAKKLAYTGADLPLTAGAALVLLGAAAGIARRRRSNFAA